MKLIDIVRQLSPRAYANYLDAFEEDENLLQRYAIDTPLRVAHLLAQILYETGGCMVLFESMNYSTPARLLEIFGVGRHSAAIRPDEVSGLLGNPQALAERVYGLGNPKKARALGNVNPGDGYRYRGGGALQTTGGDNYRRMGTKAGADFYNDPDLIVAPQYALKPALEEWTEGKLNQAADRNDIRLITRTINGGYNGLPGRQQWFDRVWPVVNGNNGAPHAWSIAQSDEDTRWLQEALNDLGASPALVVDGRYGPATTQAVKWFQSVAGIRVDGIAGEVTRATIRLRLQTIRGA